MHISRLRNTFLALLVTILSSHIAALPASAATLSGSGTIDTSSPYADPNNCGPTERYVAEGTFTLSEDGDVTVEFNASDYVVFLVTPDNAIKPFAIVVEVTGSTTQALAAGTYYLFAVDCGDIEGGSYSSATYSYSVSFDDVEPGVEPGEAEVKVTIDEDPDGDGISGSRDNCPHAYNPDQEDGWGSGAGDLCDTDWYNNTGQGVAGFVQKDGTYHLHGNCTYMEDGDPRCPVIASFDPTTFNAGDMPLNVETDFAGTWSVVVHYLHSNNGVDVYQVNTYSTNPPQPDSLIDDRLEIHVGSSSWTWQMRGGSSNYQGGTYSSGGDSAA